MKQYQRVHPSSTEATGLAAHSPAMRMPHASSNETEPKLPAAAMPRADSMATDVSCPSNASSNGAPASAAAHPRPAWRLSKDTSGHFVLPDAHLPYVYRRGLKGWQDVELYDDWLRGAVLEDENPPEDEEGVDNEEEPEGDTSRVMMLLLYVAPTRDISEGFDAPRRKAAHITGRWGLTGYQGSNHGVVLGCGYAVVMRWLFGCYFVGYFVVISRSFSVT